MITSQAFFEKKLKKKPLKIKGLEKKFKKIEKIFNLRENSPPKGGESCESLESVRNDYIVN